MDGLINYGLVDPSLTNALSAGYRGAEQNRLKTQADTRAAQVSQMNLEDLKRNRETMLKLQSDLVAAGHDPDLNKVFDALIATGDPNHVTQGIAGKQHLREQQAYAELIGGAGTPAGAPMAAPADAPMVAPVGAPMVAPAGAPMPPNTLAPPAAAAPVRGVNTMAAPPAAPPIAPVRDAAAAAATKKRIDDLMAFAATNPGMAPMAMQQAKILQDQLELQSRNAPATPATPALLQEFYAFNRMTPAEQKAFMAFKDASKPPGQSVNVQTYEPASVAAQRDFVASTRATYDLLKTVPATLRNMDKARTLIPKSADFMGPGGEPFLNAAGFLNNRLGMNIKTEGVRNATELRSVLFSGVLENLRKLDAQPTERQQNVLQQALGSIGTDPSALSNVLDAYEDILRDKVDLHNQEVKGALDNKIKFPFNPTIILPPRREAPPAAGRGTAGGPAGAPTVVRTGTAKDGRKVVELSDGTVQYQ